MLHKILSKFYIICSILQLSFSLKNEAFRLLKKSHPAEIMKLNNSMKPVLTQLIERKDLTADQTEELWGSILSGADPIQVGAALVLLRSKGETPQEIAGMVRAMKNVCKPVNFPGKLLDIVGTGGDGADTINISTAAVILAAACGCKVAKAGNRSVSSKCGSADVLEKLGVVIDLLPSQVVECIEQAGLSFMYAPINHPSMKTVAPIRKSLGVRTAFNMLGPLTNAANAARVVIGVFDEYLVDLVAGALIELGHVDHGVIVHGCGLDEVSPLGPSTIYEIKNISPEGQAKKYKTNRYLFDPLNESIPRCNVLDLKGGDADENAQALRDVLSGGSTTNAKRDSVVLNAGFGVYVYGLTDSVSEGIKLARKVLDSGAAVKLLDKWIETSQRIASQPISNSDTS